MSFAQVKNAISEASTSFSFPSVQFRCYNTTHQPEKRNQLHTWSILMKHGSISVLACLDRFWRREFLCDHTEPYSKPAVGDRWEFSSRIFCSTRVGKSWTSVPLCHQSYRNTRLRSLVSSPLSTSWSFGCHVWTRWAKKNEIPGMWILSALSCRPGRYAGG